MNQVGLTPDLCKEQNIGPVLFKEETEFRCEAHIGENITIAVELVESIRFTIRLKPCLCLR
jgi:acyl-CoA thioester hydrolase